jgi:hypothetical protein
METIATQNTHSFMELDHEENAPPTPSFMELDHEDFAQTALDVVDVVMNADASWSDITGPEPVQREGTSLCMSLTCTTEEEVHGSTNYCILDVIEKGDSPQPEQEPQGLTDLQCSQLQDIMTHFCEEVTNSLPHAVIEVLSPYERVVRCDGKMYHLYIYWDHHMSQ